MEKNNNKEKVKNKNELTNNKTAVMEQDSEKDKLYPDTLAQTKLVLDPYRRRTHNTVPSRIECSENYKGKRF